MEYTGKLNLTMLTDFYELTMANGYFQNGFTETIEYFDLFFRRIPDGGGFVIMAGVAQMVEYLENLSFSEDDLDALRGHGFSEAFLDYLRHFQFACDVWAVPEGTPVFPGEPIVTVRGPVIQAQFVETMLHRKLGKMDILVDDHTPNLKRWETAGGTGVKWLNGINGKNGRFEGIRVGSVKELKAAFDEIEDRK